ncbi:sigma-70 family RNA polymerase sigma factor [Armatimonas sp.]|uniref:RNA polymerase sigma factor n=1 Tax=Armatimonas sp. TaxID=1872638 RepID=UPI00286C7652|nr:sigma-70 family RNA polymerase sigma factor [Armatimonas sp.]
MNQILLGQRLKSLRRPAPAATEIISTRVSHLQEAHLATVFAFAQRRLPTRADAEDATAETFSAAFSALSRCPADESLHRAWLLGIARKKVADILRKRYRRNETLMEVLPERSDSAPTPETLALRAEDALQLRRAVLSLTPDQRDALLLKYTDGLSLAEIAQILGKSEAAVSSRLQRARSAVFERAAYHFLPEEPKTP